MSLGRTSLNSILHTENQYRELVNFIDKYNSQNLSFPKKIEWGDPIDHLIRYTELLDATLHGYINSDGILTASVYLPIILGNIRNHSFKEYWNSGLNKAFKIPFIHDLSQSITSISELGTSSENFPKLFFSENITVDLIDDNIFNNLNK